MPDLSIIENILEEHEKHLEGMWERLFKLQGLSLEKGDLCILAENLKDRAKVIPKKYKDNIVFSPYAKENNIYFMDRAMIKRDLYFNNVNLGELKK